MAGSSSGARIVAVDNSTIAFAAGALVVKAGAVPSPLPIGYIGALTGNNYVRYGVFGLEPNTRTTEPAGTPAVRAFTITGLRMSNLTAIGASNSLTVTIRKNGVDTTCAVTFAANDAAGTVRSITGLNIAVAASDKLTTRLDAVGIGTAGDCTGTVEVKNP